MPTVLFLCTGNYYRSRFVEHLFNARAQPLGLPWSATSRGLAVELGLRNIGPIAQVTLHALAVRGVTIPAPVRMPAQATDDDFAGAGRIIALHEAEHRPFVAHRFPAWAEQVAYWNVPDAGEMGVLEALGAMEQEVERLIEELRL